MEPWTLVALVFIIALASTSGEENNTEKENIICVASTCYVNAESSKDEDNNSKKKVNHVKE